MFKSISSVVALILAAGTVCPGQQPAQPGPVQPSPVQASPAQPGPAQSGPAVEPGKGASKTPWAVTVIHKVDLNKLIERIQKQQGVRVGRIGTAMQDPLNITTGLVVDGDGHVLTRLVNLDPEDKNQDISIVTSDGTRLPAQVVGVDCASGFTVLKVNSLQVHLPDFVAGPRLPDGTTLTVLSANIELVPGAPGNSFRIRPDMKPIEGKVSPGSIFCRARGAVELDSPGLGPRNDSSIVTTPDYQVVGMAQFAGAAQELAYLFPIEFLRNTVVKRVLERNDSIPSGSLGILGVLTEFPGPDSAAPGGKMRQAVLVSEVQPDSTASKSGIEANDIIVGFDDFDVTGPAVLTALLSSSPAGRKVKVKALRDGKSLDFDVVLNARDFESIQIPVYGPAPSSSQGGAGNVSTRNLTGDGPLTSRGGDGLTSAGFTVRDLTPQLAAHFEVPGGSLVVFVKPGSLADRAGLKAGDVIVGARDVRFPASAKLASMFSSHKGIIPLKITRNQKAMLISINLGPQQQSR
ncbi:MAG TPA: PDZ domain-containing protein [Blastocatellia bacterium]|nr:PDZ domain-containing protein [Blastocatellia bacterium]